MDAIARLIKANPRESLPRPCSTLPSSGGIRTNGMLDEIGADLREGRASRLTAIADRATFAARPMPLADADLLLCVGKVPSSPGRLGEARRGCAPSFPR